MSKSNFFEIQITHHALHSCDFLALSLFLLRTARCCDVGFSARFYFFFFLPLGFLSNLPLSTFFIFSVRNVLVVQHGEMKKEEEEKEEEKEEK